MGPMIEAITTDPTPDVPTESALHPRTPFVLLNRSLALRTEVNSYFYCPVLLLVGHCLAATHVCVLRPKQTTLKAELFFALVASNFLH